MVKVSADEFASKWGRRLKSSVDIIEKHVNAVTESPMDKAVKKKDKFVKHLTDAINSGKWESGLKRVSLDEWKKKFVSKGIPAISRGVDASMDKMRDFGSQLLPHIEEGQKIVASMPDITLEDSIGRMERFIRHMAKFKRK